MNQILITQSKNTNSYNYLYNYNSFNYIKFKNKKIYLIIFLSSIIICIIILFYFLYSHLLRLNEQTKTSLIKQRYHISTLYPTATNYNALKLSNDISIIGLIDIPKIYISYPILSNTDENLLKISVCRFSGPFPNRIGNLCIAGHNYHNSLMFSKLKNLSIGDIIYITDLNNTKLEYIIYNKQNVEQNNLNCTQSTNRPEVTLITCKENNNKERIVIKAKVKE